MRSCLKWLRNYLRESLRSTGSCSQIGWNRIFLKPQDHGSQPSINALLPWPKMALMPCSPQPQMVPMPWVPLYRWSQCSALPPPLQMASVYRLQTSLPKSISLVSNCKVRSLWEKRPCKESDHNPSKEVFSRASHLPQILSVQGQVKAARSVQTPKATENFIWADPQPALLRKQKEGPSVSENVWHPTLSCLHFSTDLESPWGTLTVSTIWNPQFSRLPKHWISRKHIRQKVLFDEGVCLRPAEMAWEAGGAHNTSNKC